MPVSQKPRKTRHRTPPGGSKTPVKKRSGLQRAVVGGFIGLIAFGLALLSVFSLERKQQNAEKHDTAAIQVTTTLLDPPGGVPCPDKDGASEKRTAFPASGPPSCLFVGHTYKARLTTDVGTFTVLLDPAKAPHSVNSFVVLARYHFYDNLTFHKAVQGFFIQSGDPPEEGITGPGYTFDDPLPRLGAYVAGSVAMANQAKGANGSQFLVLSDNAPGLVSNYPLFGQVVEGLDVVKKIAADGAPYDKTSTATPTVIHRLLKVTIIESE